MKRGEVYLADLGQPDECVIGKIRPVVIVQNDTGNLFSRTIIVCPITSREKHELPTHVKIGGLKFNSVALCEQITTIDKTNIYTDKILKVLSEDEIKQLNNGIKISLGLEENYI